MENKIFSKNDQGFICENCGKTVEKLNYTSRDHCPFCLYSKHVDIFPGDRNNTCLGLLKPIYTVYNSKKGYIINYTCKKCGKAHKNKFAEDDNMDLIIKLSACNL
jgi:rubrerythrin